jgi:hypothetical protein
LRICGRQMTRSTSIPRTPAALRRTAPALVPVGAVALVGYLIAVRGAALGAALVAVSPGVFAGAVWVWRRCLTQLSGTSPTVA